MITAENLADVLPTLKGDNLSEIIQFLLKGTKISGIFYNDAYFSCDREGAVSFDEADYVDAESFSIRCKVGKDKYLITFFVDREYNEDKETFDSIVFQYNEWYDEIPNIREDLHDRIDVTYTISRVEFHKI